jgi:hypothetical protein
MHVLKFVNYNMVLICELIYLTITRREIFFCVCSVCTGREFVVHAFAEIVSILGSGKLNLELRTSYNMAAIGDFDSHIFYLYARQFRCISKYLKLPLVIGLGLDI